LDEHFFVNDISKDDVSALNALIGQEVEITSGSTLISNVSDSRSR
jgi:hypothetical protein